MQHPKDLQISDSTNKQGLFEEIDFYCGTNSDSYPVAHKIRNLNNRYREILGWIFDSYAGWQFNDSNQTDDLLYADQTLTLGTNLYPLPATAIIVTGAEVMLQNSTTYQKLFPYTQEFIHQHRTNSEWLRYNGIPMSYQLIGDSIKILPPPNYTQAVSLRVWFWKDIVTFAVTDTAVVPGIPAMLHRALTVGASLDYALAQGKSNLQMLTMLWSGSEEIMGGYGGKEGGWKKKIKEFYSTRMAEIPSHIRLGNLSNEFK